MRTNEALSFFQEWLKTNEAPIFQIHWSEGDVSIEVMPDGESSFHGIITILGEKRVMLFHWEDGQWVTNRRWQAL